MNGKGIFIWQGKNCAGGEAQAAAQACRELGLGWAALKIGDGVDARTASYADMPAAVQAFRQAGLRVWGWHYIYGGVCVDGEAAPYRAGASPELEARFAAEQARLLALDGYIIDAEKEYKALAPAPRAAAFGAALAHALAGLQTPGGRPLPLALCSYRFPSLHPEFPWAEFLKFCTLHMPQVYWGPGRAVLDLERSLKELRALRNLPFVPLGRAYIGDGHPSPGGNELKTFLMQAYTRSCPGAGFWALDFLYLHEGGLGRRRAIAEFGWDIPPAPPAGGLPLPQPQGRVRVTARSLNVRCGPGLNYQGVGSITRDSEWYYFRAVAEWVMIGDDCWVKTGPDLSEAID